MISELGDGLLSAESWGNKVNRLSTVHQLGFAVPPALCVQAETLLLSSTQMALEGWLQTYRPSKVVVRTSSMLEDTIETARAGQSMSVADCEPNVDAIMDIVSKKIGPSLASWASGTGGLSVMFQEQLSPRLAGVAFFEPDGEFIVELSTSGATDQITSGLRPDVVVRRRGPVVVADLARFADAPIMRATHDILRLCEGLWAKFGFPIDVEWGWTMGASVVFQVRPITRPTGG